MAKGTKIPLSSDERTKCNAIIHSAAVAATAAASGMAQIPLADSAVITPIQITMIVSLGKVFGHTITKSAASGILGGAVASFVGRGVSQVLVGWIPGVGNAVNAATAAGITESIGWLAVEQFKKGSYIDYLQQKENSSSSVEEEPHTQETGFYGSTQKTDDAILRQRANNLISRAHPFIEKTKSRKSHPEEFNEILADFKKLREDEEYTGDELFDKTYQRFIRATLR